MIPNRQIRAPHLAPRGPRRRRRRVARVAAARRDVLDPPGARRRAELEPIFGVFYWANGTRGTPATARRRARVVYPDLWTPAAVGPAYSPSPLLTRSPRTRSAWRRGSSRRPRGRSAARAERRAHARLARRDDRRPDAPEGFDHPSHTLTVLRPTLDQYVATHPQFYGKATRRASAR
jgi:hypothetical protein